jgi:chemotaxis protein CheZ
MSTPAVDVHQQIGALTRQLHDSLNGLGLTEKVKDWAGELPDAKSRLSYIARLTGEAAEKVLNQVDQAKAHQAHIAAQVQQVAQLLSQDATGAIARGDIARHLTDMEQSGRKLDEHLTEIMMAQDFQDLTGQIIRRVIRLVHEVEENLVGLIRLSSARMEPSRVVQPATATNEEDATVRGQGPVVPNTHDAVADVVSGQDDVDALLSSLGF